MPGILCLALLVPALVASPTQGVPRTVDLAVTPQVYVAPITPRTFSGMHVAGLQYGPVKPCPAGVGTIRLWDNGTAWSQLQPTSAAPNFAALDNALAGARTCGVRDVLLVLGGTPAWAAAWAPLSVKKGDYPTFGAASMIKSWTYWVNWVAAVVNHAKAQTAGTLIQMHYQIWNEANLPMMWRGTPAQMAQLTSVAYHKIKSIDPHALVVAASTTVRISSFQTWYPAYLAGLARYGWPVDIFSFHGYPSSTGTTLTRDASVRVLKSMLLKARAPAKPIWDTELNYGLRGPTTSNTYRPITGMTAAVYVAQTVLDSARLGVARTYWYAWAPANTWLGIQLHANTPGAMALTTVSGWLVGHAWYGCTGPTTSGLITCRSGIARIMWSIGSRVTVHVPTGVTKVIDPIGRVTLVKVGQTWPITGVPMWFGH